MFEEKNQRPAFRQAENDLPKGDEKMDLEPTSFRIEPKDIHTMPEKFHIVNKAGGGGRRLLVILIILLVGAVLIGGAIFAYQTLLNRNENVSLVVENKNVNEEGNINAVANQNKNSNVNKNVNATGNLNRNQNLNAAANYNVNLFENINMANANLNANTNLNANVPVSQDSDADGLTDLEETLFQTKALLKDSDNDGYIDGQEVKSDYNPNGSGRLEATNLVKTYASTDFNYSILYPSSWLESADPSNPKGTMFTSDTAEFVEVIIYDNPSKLSARDWYISQSPSIDTSYITTVNNWDKSLYGVKSVDGLNVYYASGEKIYAVTYNINVRQEANYKTVFEMMYKSFKLISVSLINLNTNTNTNTNLNANKNLNANVLSNSNTNTPTNVNG